MPTFTDPARDAEAAREALRGLAHATRAVEDPERLYPVLGSLTAALASMSQALHQLGAVHDGPAHQLALAGGDPHAGRSVSYQVSWELHRAAEMVRQVADSVGHAHELEATLGYAIDPIAVVEAPIGPGPAGARGPSSLPGRSL